MTNWTPEDLDMLIERVRHNMQGPTVDPLTGEDLEPVKHNWRIDMKNIYIGIDPGQTGACAILYDPNTSMDLAIKRVFDFEDTSIIEHLQLIARQYHHGYEKYDVLVAIEKVHSMPKQGVASSFKFGTNFGIWQGRLQALEIPYIFVTPQKWQKVVFDSMARGDRKAMSLDLARRLFPWADLRLKKHHGRAEALLIARYLQITERKPQSEI